MNMLRLTRRAALGGAVTAALLAGGSTTALADQPSGDVYQGCLKSHIGVIYDVKVNASTPPRCLRRDTLITWNQTGSQGPAGPQGPKGDKGDTGAPGSDATIDGVAAGGDLTGTYPAPTIGTLPHAIATASAQQVFADGGITPVHLDSASDASDVMFSDAADSLTVHRGGVYLVDASVEWQFGKAGLRVLNLLVNGQPDGLDIRTADPASFVVNHVTTILRLDSGDTVTLGAEQNSGGALATQQAGTQPARLAVAWLGA